jgi:hypothetical protein
MTQPKEKNQILEKDPSLEQDSKNEDDEFRRIEREQKELREKSGN